MVSDITTTSTKIGREKEKKKGDSTIRLVLNDETFKGLVLNELELFILINS